MMKLQVNVLGCLEIRTGTLDQFNFSTAKAKALFAYLVVESGQPTSREKLAELLWGETSDTRARANLRQALTRVRQALPDAMRACIKSQNGTIYLERTALATDISDFIRLLDEGTIAALEDAAVLYRGDLLDGIETNDNSFEAWVRDQRQIYRNCAADCFGRLLRHYYATGASTRGIEICNRLIVIDPFQETVHRSLMSFYADQDRRGAALDQYQTCRRLLNDELGVEPAKETTALFEMIRALSKSTTFTREPALSRATPKQVDRKRTTRVVTDLVGRSPWRGASWSKPSVAVLPFECIGDQGRNGYICDGIVEDLITNLARFRDVHVIARGSSFAYRGENTDRRRISAELGVRYLAIGTLEKIGDRLRIGAQLIEADTGVHLWADKYDRDVSELEDIRDDLTRQIVTALIGRIEHHQLSTLAQRKPRQWKAYEYWLRGMDLLRKVNWNSVESAKTCFEQALTIDPNFARGHVGLAMAQYKAWSCLNWTTWWKLEDAAVQHANAALELDDEDHQVHSILGSVLLASGEVERARYHLRKAERLNPNDARNLASSAIAFALLGEAEAAIEMAELAVRLDPFHPDWYMAALGMAYFVAKDYERAIAAMEAAPDGICDTRAYLAAAHAHAGNLKAAREHVAEFIRTSCERLGGDPDVDMPLYAKSVVGKSPFVRADDTAHFVEGLRQAGLPIDN